MGARWSSFWDSFWMAENSCESVEFNDFLLILFWKLYWCPPLQLGVLYAMEVKDILDLSKFMKKPITKEVDDMDNCHFRTLYKRDCWEDNYTDPDFLCAMQINTKINYYTLTQAIVATTRMSLHLSTCFLYFIMYYHLKYDNIKITTVFYMSFSGAVVGYIIVNTWRFWNEPWNIWTLMKVPLISDFIVGFFCGFFSYMLAPILRTVTDTMDLNSVHAVCTLMFCTHLICNHYGYDAFCVSPTLSMNSAIFALICLASRLQSDNHTLALMSFGVLWFICFPQFSRMLWNWTPASAIHFLIVTYASYTVSIWCALIFVMIMFGVIIISPSFYCIYIQHKRNIHGPWDEAIPDLTIDMDEINRGFELRRSQPCPPAVPLEDPRIVEWEAMGIGKAL